MAKLIWFLATVVALVCVLTLSNYRDLPVDNQSFEQREQQRMARQEHLRQQAEQRRQAALQAAAVATKPTLVLDTPELQNGHAIYTKKGKCLTCHGKRGEGKASQRAPRLAAQHDWYIYSTLRKFKRRERVNKKMDPYIRNLSDQDFKDVAAYLSKLPPP